MRESGQARTRNLPVAQAVKSRFQAAAPAECASCAGPARRRRGMVLAISGVGGRSQAREGRTSLSDKGFFDEMGAGGAPRVSMRGCPAGCGRRRPNSGIAPRAGRASVPAHRHHLRLYGDKDAAERLIPFDIIPRLFARSEWNRLEQELFQRVKALNMFLTDVYGKQEILAAESCAARPRAAPSRLPAGRWPGSARRTTCGRISPAST